MQALNEILQIASVTLLVLTGLIMARQLKQGQHILVGIGFALSIVSYLILETSFVKESIIHPIILTGSICVPVFFWLMSKAIFDDHFRITRDYGFWFALQITSHGIYYFGDPLPADQPWVVVVAILAQILSIGFVLAGLYTAMKTRQADLVDSRLRFRNLFMVITAALIGGTLIVETTSLAGKAEQILQILQRATMLGLSAFFLMNNFETRPGFFFREMPKQKAVHPPDTPLHEKLMEQLTTHSIYRQEGLTIRQLAEQMGVQEYRLRRLINGQLGFKNFNDFLNTYRVNEAVEILSDPAQNQKTILEIAYFLGYQSIGPFNKAFKELKNTTPTSFRKATQQ